MDVLSGPLFGTHVSGLSVPLLFCYGLSNFCSGLQRYVAPASTGSLRPIRSEAKQVLDDDPRAGVCGREAVARPKDSVGPATLQRARECVRPA